MSNPCKICDGKGTIELADTVDDRTTWPCPACAGTIHKAVQDGVIAVHGMLVVLESWAESVDFDDVASALLIAKMRLEKRM